MLPPKVEVPPQYNIPGKASSRRFNIPVATASHLNNPEEKLYCAVNREEFFKDLRKLQAKTKCTNKTCVNFIRLFDKYVGEDQVSTGFQTCDRKLKEAAGVNVLELHGCTKCNNHVFLPTSKRTHCPKCGDARYATNGKAKEVCLNLFLTFAYDM